jgi:transcriptional regulator with XRE-family HTH domain
MALEIAAVFSQLRHEKKISQRKAAQDLGISQALLSHYENGIREPRLEFITKACDYYGVSADYLFGRTVAKSNPMASGTATDNDDVNSLRLTLWDNTNLRYIIGAISGLLTLLYERSGIKAAEEACNYFSASVYKLLRLMNLPGSWRTSLNFKVPDQSFLPLCEAAINISESCLAEELLLSGRSGAAYDPEKNLKKEYPHLYEAIRVLIQKTEQEISLISSLREDV